MISSGPLALLSLGLCLPALVWGADPPPQFTREGVVGAGARTGVLVPGAGMSIFGQYLGSTPGSCAAPAVGIYATNVCDTQVLIGDQPAELLFVSGKQINFKVPSDAPPSDGAELRVIYRGQTSMPLTMRVGLEKTTVSVDQPVYADMPVWLRVELPFENSTIRYPYVLGLAGFGCNEVEVRRNGEPLSLRSGTWGLMLIQASVGNRCGSYGLESPPNTLGRLPLHLLYDFQAPGTYEVRFTMRSVPFGALAQTAFKVRSEWTPFEVLPSEPNRRSEWLNSLREHLPVAPGELLTDTLPGLLGIPDEASLEILTGYLYHPDSSVRQHALNGLSYWPEESVLRTLLGLLQRTPDSSVLRRSDARNFLAMIPGILYGLFGAAAIPYLKRALSTEGEDLVARNIALQLMIADDPVGFQFAARVVEQKRDSEADMIQVLKGQFPELQNADSNAVAAFVERRASQAVADHPETK